MSSKDRVEAETLKAGRLAEPLTARSLGRAGNNRPIGLRPAGMLRDGSLRTVDERRKTPELSPRPQVRAVAACCPLVLGGDHPLVLAGLRALLAKEPGLRVVGEVAGSAAAFHAAEMAEGVLVLVARRWSDSLAEGLTGLRARAPEVRVVLITAEVDRDGMRQFLVGGGRAALSLDAPVDEVLTSIRIARPAISAGWDIEQLSLSERESLVLRRKANGYANKSIASELVISVKTVETYYTRGMEKLGLKSRVKMLQYGVVHGWIDASH